MPTIATRVSALRPTAVNAILAEVKALQGQGKKTVSLMRGEPDFKTPEHIVDAAVRALRDGRTGYPDNRGEIGLRAAVAEKLQRENGLSYDPASEVLITDGATLGIQSALLALLNEGDDVLLPDPVYDAYQSPVRLAGGRIVPVRSRIADGRFYLDIEALETAWTPATKLLLLNTPWNPVGTVFTVAEMQAVEEFVERRNLILISDEIYERITYGEHRHVSPRLRDRCILVNSFSKTYAMTGWRLGYCAGPKEIIHAMFMVLAQSSRGPATFIQDAGAVALAGPQDCVDEMRKTYTERRALVIDRLRNIPKVRVLEPEGGFFCMLDIRDTGIASNEARLRLLHDAGVVVIHGAAYGPGGEGTLRVSFASGGENLEAGLARLREGLTAL